MGFWGNFGKALSGALGAMGHGAPGGTNVAGVATKPRQVTSPGVSTGGMKAKRPLSRPLSAPRSMSKR